MGRKFTHKFLVAIMMLAGLSLVLFANTALAAPKKPYQLTVGEQWSRTPYDGKFTSNNALNKLIQATARVDKPRNTEGTKDSGTAFYLGKFADAHIMLTNHHVISDVTDCRDSKNKTRASIHFQNMDESFLCGGLIKRFPDIDATFFTVIVPKDKEHLFEKIALQFDFKNTYKPGDKLVTAGYGKHLNGGLYLTTESSQTCVVLTSTDQPKLVYEDDTKIGHPSFGHGCEISHGDSGSAVVSELSGKVVGLNWLTSLRKPVDVMNTMTVFDWMEKNDPRLWNSFSYSIPAKVLMEKIQASNEKSLNEFLSSNILASELQ